jgi:hypothetical protein
MMAHRLFSGESDIRACGNRSDRESPRQRLHNIQALPPD